MGHISPWSKLNILICLSKQNTSKERREALLYTSRKVALEKESEKFSKLPTALGFEVPNRAACLQHIDWKISMSFMKN